MVTFFKRGDADMVSIKTDNSTVVELIATDEHKSKYEDDWLKYKPAPLKVKKAKKKDS